MKILFYKNWKASIINNNFTIIDAIKNLNKTALQICFVVKKNKFIGTVTDGDIRRALIKGYNLESNILKIMNKKPKFVYEKNLKNKNFINTLKQKFPFFSIPILNYKNQIVDMLINKKNYYDLKKVKCEMVIIAGGKGKRLLPLTKKTPKALIKVNGKPMLENIILKGKKEGIKNFNIVTNHFHGKIKKYFKYGNNLNVKLRYFRESLPLGTAGGLSLLKGKLKNVKLLIVTNCDIFTNLNYNDIIDYHKKNKNEITIASRFFRLDNPYGVLKLDKKNHVFQIDEKPSENYLISAGVYIINYKVINFIKKKQKIDMTDFINFLTKKKIKIGSFPIYENWSDIGNKLDLKKINNLK
jgi:dTDP-glucose pyrophosphorylase